jgi:transcriptional regulator with XRE-family HTH domain
MPPEERAICERLREVRGKTGLSRVAFARAIGIDSSLLANYELSKVQVPFLVAFRAARLASVNLRWIMHGKLSRDEVFEDWPDLLEELIPARALFSHVCKKVLSQVKVVELHKNSPLQALPAAPSAWLAFSDAEGGGLIPQGADQRVHLLIEKGKSLPEPFRTDFLLEIGKAAARALKKYKGATLSKADQSLIRAEMDSVSKFIRRKLAGPDSAQK